MFVRLVRYRFAAGKWLDPHRLARDLVTAAKQDGLKLERVELLRNTDDPSEYILAMAWRGDQSVRFRTIDQVAAWAMPSLYVRTDKVFETEEID